MDQVATLFLVQLSLIPGEFALVQVAETPSFFYIPEKALLDFIYLNLSQFSPVDGGIFSESYRLDGLDALHRNRLVEYATRFDSQKLLRVVDLLIHDAAFKPQPNELSIDNCQLSIHN